MVYYVNCNIDFIIMCFIGVGLCVQAGTNIMCLKKKVEKVVLRYNIVIHNIKAAALRSSSETSY